MTAVNVSTDERPSFDHTTLYDLAGERSFERGREYFICGQVRGFTGHGGGREALVLGTCAYRVGLSCEAERVLFRCECPVGQAGRFCKHAVALGFRWLSGKNEEGSIAACERLLEQAINSLSLGLCANEWFELAGTMLNELLQSRPVEESVKVIENAMSKIAEARSLRIEEGGRDGKWEKVEEMLCEYHVTAIHDAMMGDAMMGAGFAARRVLNWQLKQAGAGFDAGSLGEKLHGGHGERWGDDWRAAYQSLAEGRWQRLARIDDERPTLLNLVRRRQLTWLARRMEGMGTEGRKRQIADQGDGGCADASVVRLWREFAASPTPGRFEQLRECAQRSDQWLQWREQVFEYLRQRADQTGRPLAEKKRSFMLAGDGADNSGPVYIWLAEGEVEAAAHAAKAGDCADDLWLQLAALRIRTDPAEALVIYQRLVRKSLIRKDRYSAGQAKKLLRKTRRLMKRLGREEEYEEFMVELGRVFGKQRNFAIIIACAV